MAPNITDLPNCLLEKLLLFLDATSLYMLSQTCRRFDSYIGDSTRLWRRVDARDTPNNIDKVAYCTYQVHETTNHARFRGYSQDAVVMPETFYPRIFQYNHLKLLSLENQTIYGRSFQITSFPQSLEELSLRQTLVVDCTEFFRYSVDGMTNLRVLILDECDWFLSSSLMAISKYKNLEILSVYKCRNLDSAIPYWSLSGQFGFKKLKVLDARLSALGTTIFRSFYKSRSLLAIYIQNEDISYKLDYFKRKLEIIQGKKLRDFPTKEEEFDVLNDLLRNEERGTNFEKPSVLDDNGIADYVASTSVKTDASFPESALYLDPYSPCECSFGTSRKKKCSIKPGSSSSSNDDDNDDDDDGGDGGGSSNFILKTVKSRVCKLRDIVRRSQVDGTFSRGLYSENRETTDTLASGGRMTSNVVKVNLRVNNNEYEAQLIHRSVVNNNNNNSNNNNNNACNSSDVEIEDDSSDDEPEEQRQNINVRRAPKRKLLPVKLRLKIRKFREGGIVEDAGDGDLPNEDGNDTDTVDEDDVPEAAQPENNPAAPLVHVRCIEIFPALRLENLRPPNEGGGVHFLRAVRLNEPIQTSIPIRRLSLRGFKRITDAALYFIRGLDLEILDLTYTKVTKAAIDNYLVNHPYCRVVHESFCTCPTNLHF